MRLWHISHVLELISEAPRSEFDFRGRHRGGVGTARHGAAISKMCELAPNRPENWCFTAAVFVSILGVGIYDRLTK